MGDHQIAAKDLLWALGSCCALAGRPFDAQLVLQQVPPPHTLASLVSAARGLGLQARLRTLPLDRLAGERGPLVLRLRDEAGAAALGLLVQADDETITWIPAGSHEPLTQDVASFAQAYAGEVVQLRRPPEPPQDPDRAAANAFGFRWFVPELMKHRKVWRDVLGASLVLQLLALGLPLFTQALIDKVVVHRTESTLLAIAAGMAIFLAATAIFSWVRQYLVLHTGNRVDAVLAAHVFGHLLRLPPRYFQHRPTGVIAARLHGVETIREFVSSAAVTLVLDTPFLLIALAVMLHYSVALTGVVLAVLAVIAAVSAGVAPLFQRRLDAQFLLGARNQAFVTEYIAGIETVKSLQFEPQLQARYGEYLAAYLHAGFRTRQLGNTYVYALGGGLDTIIDAQGQDTLAFGPGLTPERVVLRIVPSAGGVQARLRVLDDAGRELPGQGVDFAMQRDARGRLSSPIEHFVFADGRWLDWGDLLGAPLALVGTRAADLLIGGRGAETLRGDAGDDVLYAGAGNDTLYGDAGNDLLYGHGGKDRLWGGNGDDVLDGGAGDDLLVGENGSDWLVDREGDNVLDGGNHDDVLLAGAGADCLQGGNGDDWLAGGRGNDRLETGTGRNLVAFNRGDGWDRLDSGGRDVLSLGGGLRLSDLRLSRSGADLRIDLGQGDGLTLEGWYASGPGKRVDTLQLVTVDTAGARSERFDFARIVQAFDKARAPQGGWSAMEAALGAHLGTSKGAALGGELSIQYATTGSLAGLDPINMHALIGAGPTQLKALPAGYALASGAPRLLA